MGFLQKFLEQFATLFTKSVPPSIPPSIPAPPETSIEPSVVEPVAASFFLTDAQMRQCVLAAGASQKVNAQLIAEAMQEACIKFGITTRLQLAHLLAHLGHESVGFSRTVENMIYSQQRLVEVFGHRVSWAQAHEIAGDEFATAETVYGMRADLGNVNEGDGFLFRGHFFIQLTGRSNHQKCANYFSISVEELLKTVNTLAWNCEVSCWYCTEFRKGFRIAAEANNLVQSTQAVNGGQTGFSDRQQRLNSILRVMETF